MSAAKRRRSEAEKLQRLELNRKREQTRNEQLEKEAKVRNEVHIPNPKEESPEERAWIVARIKGKNENDKRKRDQERISSSKTAWLRRMDKNSILGAKEDLPIEPKNYPIMWGYLRQLWADRARSEN